MGAGQRSPPLPATSATSPWPRTGKPRTDKYMRSSRGQFKLQSPRPLAVKPPGPTRALRTSALRRSSPVMLFAACPQSSSHERGRSCWRLTQPAGLAICTHPQAIVSKLYGGTAEVSTVFESMTDGESASSGAMEKHGGSRSLTTTEEANENDHKTGRA